MKGIKRFLAVLFVLLWVCPLLWAQGCAVRRARIAIREAIPDFLRTRSPATFLSSIATITIVPPLAKGTGTLGPPLIPGTMPKSKEITGKQRDGLLRTLKARFDAHMHRHAGLEWTTVHARLEANSPKLWSLSEMEQSGGEPDVVGLDQTTGECLFMDCSAQSPKGRRSVCYDGEALKARKEHKPKTSALEMATAMGAALLTADDYQRLQTLDQFDTTTSSWVQTPAKIRRLGGALFCDRRYDTVFVYHNGAESYYAARGFRCSLQV